MIDINLIRDNLKQVQANLKKRNDPAVLKLLDEVIKLDADWRKKKYKLQEMVSEKKKITMEINELRKNNKPFKKKIQELKDLPKKVEKHEADVEKLKDKIKKMLLSIPNLLDESVPAGKDESKNKELRKVGKITKPSFELKSHVEVAENLDMVDFDQSAKIAGGGFYYLKGDLALLNQAIVNFARDTIVRKGYTYMEPPLMMRKDVYEGVTDLGAFEDVLYKIDNEDLYMIATSEHPLTALYMNGVLQENQLPVKLVGYSMCFRKEVGSRGIDTKGLFRTHQFNKVEQYVFCKPEQSEKLHEELLANCELMLKKLGLPYRVITLCSGDTGYVAAKTYDLEVWMPRGKEYREVTSCSNCTDYQARRLNIKYGHHGGKKDYLHTLNATAVATSRVMVAILENFQQKDGSVKIPTVLQPYIMGKKKLVKQ